MSCLLPSMFSLQGQKAIPGYLSQMKNGLNLDWLGRSGHIPPPTKIQEAPIHPSICHLSSTYPGWVCSGRRRCRACQTSLSNAFLRRLGNPEMFPGQMGCIILPMSSVCPSNWTCPKDPHREVTRKHPH